MATLRLAFNTISTLAATLCRSVIADHSTGNFKVNSLKKIKFIDTKTIFRTNCASCMRKFPKVINMKNNQN